MTTLNRKQQLNFLEVIILEEAEESLKNLKFSNMEQKQCTLIYYEGSYAGRIKWIVRKTKGMSFVGCENMRQIYAISTQHKWMDRTSLETFDWH